MKNSSTLTLSYRGKGFADTVCNREQEDEQDKEVERLHLAAIQGELRLKRNRGVGVDDSDEESDNEENERARRAMKRLRTTDRDDIKDLGAWYLSIPMSILNMVMQRLTQIRGHLPTRIIKVSKMMINNSHILKRDLNWRPPLLMYTKVMTMRKRMNHRNVSRLMKYEDSYVSGLQRHV